MHSVIRLTNVKRFVSIYVFAFCFLFCHELSLALEIESDLDTVGQTREIKVYGDYLLVADGYNGLLVVDVSTPSSPTELARVDVHGSVYSLDIYNDYAFLAAREGGIVVVDLINIKDPQVIVTLPTMDKATDIVIYDTYAVVADRLGGVLVYDISIPASPVLLSQFDDLVAATGVYVENDYVFVNDYWYAFLAIDLQEPSTPVLVDELQLEFKPRDLKVDGDTAFVVGDGVGLHTIDVTDPANMEISGVALTAEEDGFPQYSVYVRAGYAFMGVDKKGVQVVDISDTTSPKVIDNVFLPKSICGITGDAKFLYTGGMLEGVNVIEAEQYLESLYVVSTLETAGQARDLEIVGGHLLVADGYGGMLVVDITIPESPLEVAKLPVPGSVYAVDVKNDYAYLAAREGGVVVVDLSDILAPQIVATVPTIDRATDVFVYNNYLMVADRCGGLLIFDIITTPELPSLIGQFDALVAATGVFVRDGYAFVNDYWYALLAIDIVDPTLPVLASELFLDFKPRDLVVEEDTAFVVGDGRGLHTVDITDPNNMQIIGVVAPLEGEGASQRSIFASGNYAFMGVDGKGVQVLDISDKFSPVVVGSVSLPKEIWGITANDSFVFSGGLLDGVNIVSRGEFSEIKCDNTISDFGGNIQSISNFDTPGQARGVVKAGKTIFVADGTHGLLVLEVQTDGSMVKIGSYPLTNGGRARSLHLVEDILYVACRAEGLFVFNVESPDNPILIDSFDTNDMATFITVDDNILYLSDRRSLLLFDISDPMAPVLLSELVAPTEFEHVVVENGIAYIAGYYSGLVIVDVINPELPVILSQTQVGYPLWAVEKQGDYLYAGGEQSGLLVLELQDLASPTIIAHLDLPDLADPKPADQPPYHMFSLNQKLFIADGYSGILMVDIKNPFSPFIDSTLPSIGHTWDFFIDNSTLVIGDYRGGVQLADFGLTLDMDGDSYPNFIDNYPYSAHCY
ncbi:LVIVD repeat-containing protein [Desulforhopalus sp. 52FAK]